jgi:hypothetical protein
MEWQWLTALKVLLNWPQVRYKWHLQLDNKIFFCFMAYLLPIKSPVNFPIFWSILFQEHLAYGAIWWIFRQCIWHHCTLSQKSFCFYFSKLQKCLSIFFKLAPSLNFQEMECQNRFKPVSNRFLSARQDERSAYMSDLIVSF